MRQRSSTRLVSYALLALVAVVNIAPIYYMAISALRQGGGFFVADHFLPPLHPQWRNFSTLFADKGFARLFLNSAIVTVASTAASLVIGAVGAFGFTRLRSRWGDAAFVVTVMLIAIPPIVVLVPLFLLAARIGLVDNLLAPVIIYTGFMLPFSVLMLRNYFEAIPADLVEAARIDGAGNLRVLWHVVLPLSRAPLVTLAVVNGVWAWNELLIAIVFLQSESLRTLQAGIAFFSGRNVQDVPLIMAGSLVATVPILVLFVLGQRAFVRGLVGGAMKE